MAYIEFQWVKTEFPVRISEYANELGFNLRTIDDSGLSIDVRETIDGKIRNQIMYYLDEVWSKQSGGRKPLSEITQGVYVITLSDNLSIDYNGVPSKVLYIGRGRIRSRIYNHMKLWVRYLSDSLRDISLDFWMAEIRVNGSKNAFKEVESDLLNNFYERFKCYLLQNRKSGDYHEKTHDYHDHWSAPLRNPSNIQHGWAIKPLKSNPWAIKFDDA